MPCVWQSCRNYPVYSYIPNFTLCFRWKLYLWWCCYWVCYAFQFMLLHNFKSCLLLVVLSDRSTHQPIISWYSVNGQSISVKYQPSIGCLSAECWLTIGQLLRIDQCMVNITADGWYNYGWSAVEVTIHYWLLVNRLLAISIDWLLAECQLTIGQLLSDSWLLCWLTIN